MGVCFSSSGIVEVSEDDRRKHRDAEKLLKEVRPLSLPMFHLALSLLIPLVSRQRPSWPLKSKLGA